MKPLKKPFRKYPKRLRKKITKPLFSTIAKRYQNGELMSDLLAEIPKDILLQGILDIPRGNISFGCG